MTHVEALQIALQLIYTRERQLAPSAHYAKDDAGKRDYAEYIRLQEASKTLERLQQILDPFQMPLL